MCEFTAWASSVEARLFCRNKNCSVKRKFISTKKLPLYKTSLANTESVRRKQEKKEYSVCHPEI